jgi:hypothetical protein
MEFRIYSKAQTRVPNPCHREAVLLWRGRLLALDGEAGPNATAAAQPSASKLPHHRDCYPFITESRARPSVRPVHGTAWK